MAILFVTLGLYGVVAYSVSRQTAEIGVRLAMGAQRSTIVRMVVGQGLTMGAAGAVLGAALAFWLTRLLTRWLFTITPGDPATFIAATAFVLGVTLAASYIPGAPRKRHRPADRPAARVGDANNTEGLSPRSRTLSPTEILTPRSPIVCPPIDRAAPSQRG